MRSHAVSWYLKPAKFAVHLIAQHCDDSRFSILAQDRSPIHLFALEATTHLFALEATFIKTSHPVLCRQKDFVYNLKIVLHEQRSLIGLFPANHLRFFAVNCCSFFCVFHSDDSSRQVLGEKFQRYEHFNQSYFIFFGIL